MSVLDTIRAAQLGEPVRTLGAAAGLQPHEIDAALEVLVPEILRRLRSRTAREQERDYLLQALERGGQERYLEGPRELLSRAAIKDGEEILVHLYGSLDSAQRHARAIGARPGMDEALFERLMTYAATLTLAALARRYRLLRSPTAPERRESFAAAMILALGEGILEGVKRAFLPKRRRHRYGRRPMVRVVGRRREPPPDLDELLGDHRFDC